MYFSIIIIIWIENGTKHKNINKMKYSTIWLLLFVWRLFKINPPQNKITCGLCADKYKQKQNEECDRNIRCWYSLVFGLAYLIVILWSPHTRTHTDKHTHNGTNISHRNEKRWQNGKKSVLHPTFLLSIHCFFFRYFSLLLYNNRIRWVN